MAPKHKTNLKCVFKYKFCLPNPRLFPFEIIHQTRPGSTKLPLNIKQADDRFWSECQSELLNGQRQIMLCGWEEKEKTALGDHKTHIIVSLQLYSALDPSAGRNDDSVIKVAVFAGNRYCKATQT